MVRKIIALGFSEAAKNPEIRRIISNVLTDASVHSIPDRDPSSSVNWPDDRNQLEYLLRRVDMHCDINCEVATGSLWKYHGMSRSQMPKPSYSCVVCWGSLFFSYRKS